MQSAPSPQVEALGASRQERLRRLIAQPFAHRGLHGDGRVENSVAAFEAAIAAGHGFELDVQETADGQALVFHDYTLERLTSQKGAVRQRVMADLAALTLAGADQRLVTLNELVRRIGNDSHILVEVKTRQRTVGRDRKRVVEGKRVSGEVDS